MPATETGKGDIFPCLRKKATVDWPSWTRQQPKSRYSIMHSSRIQAHLVSMILSQVSHVSVQMKLCPHWWGLWVLVLFGVGLLFWWCCLFCRFGLFPPPICRVSNPSMMTWAHRPHGVRTREKMKKRRDYNVEVAFCGFLLVFVFSWKFITPTELKLCKTQTGWGPSGTEAVPRRYRARCNRGPERYRSAPRIVIKARYCSHLFRP